MPKVVFREDFFDGSRRYRKGREYDVADHVTLPSFDIDSIDGKSYVRPKRDNVNHVVKKRPTKPLAIGE